MPHSNPEAYREYQRQYARRQYATPEGRANVQARQHKYLLNKPQNSLLIHAKNRAKKFGIPCNITADDIIIPSYCPILGMPLVIGQKIRRAKNSPSLDRINPKLGYVKGNIRVISMLANMMKSDATEDQLLTFAANIGVYLENKS